jgi:hypothetical protein
VFAPGLGRIQRLAIPAQTTGDAREGAEGLSGVNLEDLTSPRKANVTVTA